MKKITQRFEDDVFAKLEEIALQRGISINRTVREMLELGLSHYVKDGAELANKNRYCLAEKRAALCAVEAVIYLRKMISAHEPNAVNEVKAQARELMKDAWNIYQ